MRLLFLALSLSSSVVLAQTTTTNTLQLTIGGLVNDTFTVGGASPDCSLNRTLTWTLNTSAQACNEMAIWLTSASSCPDTPASGDFTVTTVTASDLNGGTRSGTANFNIGQLPGFSGGDGGESCGEQGVTKEFRVCASVKLFTGTFGATCDNVTTFTKGNTLKVVYDTQAPDVPTLKSVVGVDSALRVEVEANGGSPTEFRVEVRNPADGSVVTSRQQTVSTTSFRMDGLTNNTTYSVVAFAVDAAGNVSAATDAQNGTPVKTNGFFQTYVDAGGQETGGCNVAGGGLAGGAVLAALGFWLSSRRNRS